jgi:hypothetical protein
VYFFLSNHRLNTAPIFQILNDVLVGGSHNVQPQRLPSLKPTQINPLNYHLSMFLTRLSHIFIGFPIVSTCILSLMNVLEGGNIIGSLHTEVDCPCFDSCVGSDAIPLNNGRNIGLKSPEETLRL